MGRISAVSDNRELSVVHSDFTDRGVNEDRYMAWRIVAAIESIDRTSTAAFIIFLFSCVVITYLLTRKTSFEKFGNSLFER